MTALVSRAQERLRTVVETLTQESGQAETTDLATALTACLTRAGAAEFWFTVAVLRGEFPDVPAVEEARRIARLDGVGRFVERELDLLHSRQLREELPPVRVLRDAVTVDVHHTAEVDFVSGIQRVVRETVRRWTDLADPVLVGWADDYSALRILSEPEVARMCGRPLRPETAAEAVPREIVVPWRGVHIVPELTAEPQRTTRMQALAAHANTEVCFIGYDCIPVTSGETVTAGMTSNFARYLAVVRHADRVAAISRASADEFRGLRDMVRAAGFPGAEICEIELPVTAMPSTPAQVQRAERDLCIPGLPLVLVVGSHEPRKNHLAVLHAAELLWREGIRFSLCFVGAGSWKSEAFYADVQELRRAGRPVEVVSRMDDEMLWAAYRIAHCVVFPSLNEGFGLPAAEALATGTPVITSDFGSMREILAPDGEPVGGLLVDPRDDRSLTQALRTMLTDRVAYLGMRGDAGGRRPGDWDDYAARTWRFLTGR